MDMKRYFIFILACLLCLGLASCVADSTTAEAEEKKDINGRFEEVYYGVENGASTRILVDTETGVMYFYAKTGYGGGLTVMVDKDGKPLIYKEGTEDD